jgi:G3E family GTPase
MVNDMGEINIDAETIKQGGGLKRTEEKLVEMSKMAAFSSLFVKTWIP